MPEKTASYTGGVEGRSVSFFAMFWDGLKPFPGRGRLTLRLAIACTLIVLVSYTFRMPFQDLMPFFVLFVTKEEKVTTIVTVVLVLFAVTIAIAAAILIYKFTGTRAELRIPAIALEIFIGMYLFRVFAIGAVGWIIGFVCAASQSVVYLFPSAEEVVHQFLWLWVAIAFSIAIAFFANLAIFPVSPTDLFRREFAAGWRALSGSTEKLAANMPSAGQQLLRSLVEHGPIRFLKLLKLSSMASRSLHGKQAQVKRMILGLDRVARLVFSYARFRLKSSAGITSRETAILGGIAEKAQYFQREVEAGVIPPAGGTAPGIETTGESALQLLEAETTLKELLAEEPENRAQESAAARHKPSLFVPGAFSNPAHAQFAIKVTLAGMIGYLFYTASDYYGIHTVFYTPLIIALASTGATIHKGFLRIIGCIIGGGLGLICLIWVIPRFETFQTFLLIVFCVHALAAWIAVGSEQISYMGLQIALAFDLGFLQGYGPTENIDPLRDRFIGIVLGICIVTTVFALLWPESAEFSARERLAAALRAITRLLRESQANRDSQIASGELNKIELEVVSRLSEASAYTEQAAFEAVLYGAEEEKVSRLEAFSSEVEEIYASCLPWLRRQNSGTAESSPTFEQLSGRVEQMLARVETR
jgi:multidrug resistance protein MdtO